MAISAKEVMSLRRRTGLGMMECKQALTETKGDLDAAIELLRKKSKGKMDERADRSASEGVIAVAKSDAAIAMVELLSETDFAARNNSFVDATGQIAELALAANDGPVSETKQMTNIVDELRITIKENISLGRAMRISGGKLGSYVHHNNRIGTIVQVRGDFSDELLTGLCQHVAAAEPMPLAVDDSGLPADLLEQQRAAAVADAKESGKPPEIAEKIAGGKLRKWVDDNTLLGQIYLRDMDAKKPVRDYLTKGSSVQQFVRFKIGD